MSHILLIRPPAIFASSNYSCPVTMPLGIAYLAANLLKHGHTVQCIDAIGAALDHMGVSYSPSIRYRGLPTEEILDRITETPDAIGVTAMFSQDWPHIQNILNAIHKKYPDMPIILGGEHATALPEYILNSCHAVKYVALGEGEQTIVDFAEFLDDRISIENIGGIWYRCADCTIKKNPDRARLRVPDDLPWPAWHLFDLKPYFEVGEGHGVERGRSMPILATRGCPYQCTFCSNPTMWTRRYVTREVSLVIDEIEYYIKQYQAENFDFYDLTAIIKKSWLMEFCREIETRSLKITWQLPSGTRIEQMDEEAFSAMVSTGCTNMTFAPESGSIRTLKEIKKQISLPHFFKSIPCAKRQGLFVKCNLIIGFPNETRKDILTTVWTAFRFALLGVDDTGLYLFSPYPGSELFSHLLAKGTIKKIDYDYFEGLMSFMGLDKSTRFCKNVGPKELNAYRIIGMSSFYALSYLLHPSRIFRSLRNYHMGCSDTVFEERFFALLRRRKLEKSNKMIRGE